MGYKRWGAKKTKKQTFFNCKRCGNRAKTYLKEVIENKLCYKCRCDDDKKAYLNSKR